MSDESFLNRRREINRRAAAKSRRRLKEHASRVKSVTLSILTLCTNGFQRVFRFLNSTKTPPPPFELYVSVYYRLMEVTHGERHALLPVALTANYV